jgi:hypothetical protein
LIALAGSLAVEAAPQLELQLPLGRVAYQTNERLDVSLLRRDAEPLRAGTLDVTVTGDDGSRLRFAFPLPALAITGPAAEDVLHLQLNGRLLRPGRYTLQAAADGASTQAVFEIYSHLRKSTYKTVRWGITKGEPRLLGEDSLGFTLNYGPYNAVLDPAYTDDTIRGGMDAMPLMALGGGHQQDLRLECDWSDPYVIRGAAGRVSRAALANRTAPNVIGVHLHDEPGLTWWEDPVTGKAVPHNIPAQDRAWLSAYGSPSPRWNEIKPDDPASLGPWLERCRWKLSFVEAAWRLMRDRVEDVRPYWLTVNQHMYGWYAYGDGYYFNVGRSLPVLNGHGGYDSGAGFYPAWYFELGRVRELHKPAWYMPTFDTSLRPAVARTEHYQTFLLHGEGVMVPLWQDLPSRITSADGLAEVNHALRRLGPIFDTLPLSRPPAAVLYSVSQCLGAQARDMTDGYDGGQHKRSLYYVCMAARLAQLPLEPIVEEDVLDGTLARTHKLVILPAITYLDGKVVAALEAFAAAGGTVLLSEDCRVAVRGAKPLGPINTTPWDEQQRLWKAGDQEGSSRAWAMANQLPVALPLARQLQAVFAEAGVQPVLTSDNPGIWAARHAAGEIEYFFAVNATHEESDLAGETVRPAVATLALPPGNGAVYDALRGQPLLPLQKATPFRFGAGQLRVFARTARPIGGVLVHPPTVAADFTGGGAPLCLRVTVTLLDNAGRVLSGSAPLQVQVTDPLGAVRYDLFRATRDGVLTLELPLAANDPGGQWTATARELLSGTAGSAGFAFTPPAQCGALAGARRRALCIAGERQNVYRFVQRSPAVTVVTGTAPYHAAAADRLAAALRPWGVACRTVAAADVNRAREVSAEEAPTLIGLDYSPRGTIKAGRENNPALVGFDVQGPVILLGSPADNPLIKSLADRAYLPYAVTPAFPGPRRGLIAWQRDAVGINQESLTLIGADAEGLGEAVGTLYEFAAGIEPLLELDAPLQAAIEPARTRLEPAPLAEQWRVALPGRVTAVRAAGGGLLALSDDGLLTALDKDGRLRWQSALPPAAAYALAASDDARRIAVAAGKQSLLFDAAGKPQGALALADGDALVTAVAVAADGSRIAVAGEFGRVALFGADGKRAWRVGGEAAAAHAAALGNWQDEAKAWAALPEDQRKAKPLAAKPTPPDPNPVLSIEFAADGQTLVACTRDRARFVALGDGSLQGDCGGVNGRFTPVRMGGDWLVTDGQRTLSLVSSAERKALRQMALPGDAAVAIADLDGRVAVATEADGVIRLLKSLDGNAEEQTVWTYQRRTRAVKRLAPRPAGLAVGYWGGTLELLDPATGAPKSATHLPQDITDLLWLGNTLVAALADGHVIALR